MFELNSDEDTSGLLVCDLDNLFTNAEVNLQILN